MPICFRSGRIGAKGEAPEKLPTEAPSNHDWPEPPGYLGEAVRRAKRISSAPSQNRPTNSSSKDGRRD
jgi:hypothetical protein